MSEQACTWEKMFLAIETVVNISQIIQTVVTLRCIKMSFTVLYAPNSFSNICNCLSSFLMFRSLGKMLWGQKLLLPCQVKTCGGNLPPLPPCFHHLWGLICYSMSSWSAKKSTICIVHLSIIKVDLGGGQWGILIFAAFFCQMLPVSEVCRLSVKLVPR